MSDRLGCRVKQVYGMTELGGYMHVATDTGRDDPGSSCGKLLRRVLAERDRAVLGGV